jgi:protein-S-isoprenylcysteine O-methyltransferase Ste14
MDLRNVALAVVLGATYVRVIAVLIGAIRSAAARTHARTARFGVVEILAAFEFVVLAVVAYPVYRAAIDSTNSTFRTAAAVTGATLALLYVGLLVGVLVSWRDVHTGAIVVEDQQLVTTGIYGIIRHPLYTGAFVLWAAVALANLSLLAAVLFVFYVVPTYRVYMGHEERMMKAEFGDAYTQYCARVPRLLPHPWRKPGRANQVG